MLVKEQLNLIWNDNGKNNDENTDAEQKEMPVLKP
jgi:hypothetical protein